MGLTRLDLTAASFADGRPFGEIGAYEQLDGEATFAVDPAQPLNAVITDLALAPRGLDGCVSMTADVRILRPLGRGNGGLFLDVVNRGQSNFDRHTERGAFGSDARVIDGFLLQRGYTIVLCGWQHDIPRRAGRFGLTAPEALLPDRQRISGRVTTMKQIDAPADVLGPFDGSSPATGYPALDLNEPGATLTVYHDPCGPGETLPRDRWRFVDPVHVALDGGFQPGDTYELAYTAPGAPVTGIGLLALRDVVSFLRFATTGNPCAGQLDFALAMGGSQTGRLLRQLIYLGCCEDEQGRLAIDGVLAIAAGARMTEANWRFGQPGAQGPRSAVFPFTDIDQTDPSTGAYDGLLHRATARGRVPKVIHVNTSSEYCSSAAICHISAALSHLSSDGAHDVDLPDNVRMYHLASTQHAPSPLTLEASALGVFAPNTIDYRPFVRAAVDNLSAWVCSDVAPPASHYPRLDNATLVPRDVVRARLPDLPRRPFCLDVDLIPAVDEDGNEIAGLRHPDVSVPLATYTGWNPRRPALGGEGLLLRSTGATIPFAREAVTARYASREAFLEQVRVAADALVEQRYLLAEDVTPVLEESGRRYDEFLRPSPSNVTTGDRHAT